MDILNSTNLIDIVLYTTIALTILSIVSIGLLLIIKNNIDSYEKNISREKQKYLELLLKNNISKISLKSDIETVALSEAIVEIFKSKNHQNIMKIKPLVLKYDLASKIFELYQKSFTSFYKHYYISILIELRSEKYRKFFQKQIQLQNITNEQAGYYLYALAILQNDYKQLIILYNSLVSTYQNHNIGQLFSELVISEAFENGNYQDIKKFFCEFLINENISSILISFIYAIDERKDCDWDEILTLFSNKYKNNIEISEAISNITSELNRR